MMVETNKEILNLEREKLRIEKEMQMVDMQEELEQMKLNLDEKKDNLKRNKIKNKKIMRGFNKLGNKLKDIVKFFGKFSINKDSSMINNDVKKTKEDYELKIGKI